MNRGLWVFFGAVALVNCTGPATELDIPAGSLEIGIDGRGWVVSLQDSRSGAEFLPDDQQVPILTLRTGGEDLVPIRGEFQETDSTLSLDFGSHHQATIQLRVKNTHATFELLSVEGTPVDLAIWGPYPTTISEIIGETVGVVRGSAFAMGIQGLNPKTLGGYPWNQNDAMPQLDIFESGDYSDLSEEGKRHVLYRVEAAKPDSFGSTLQAYTRNRSTPRVIPNWGHERYSVPAFEDGGVVGSKIALFGSPVGDALATVGSIEVAEGLPHPIIDGEWGKVSPGASAAYVILPFSESTIDDAIDVVLGAGLRYLYHPEPFENWGHFDLGGDFPSGVSGLRAAVDAAEARGVHVGVHTLSNFITTDDSYVTPVPDSRLARVGTTQLAESIGPGDTEVAIQHPGFFNQFGNNHLRAAVVGDEILRYATVSEGPPWRLLDVERGAFGTQPGAHAAGEEIGKLADHGYRVFLSNPDLSMEMARALGELFNQTGLRQISFDGLEGNRSTGMGNYGEILFTNSWYEALSEDIRGHYIADASRTSHYFWHIYSRMNWGEPWYAGFRESQTEYRLKNQAYFRRNMMPGMLGWFRMQPETTVEDIEWMLARSAAFDAGYAFVTSFDALEENGRADEILALIGRWEEARMADAFSPSQKERMEDIGREFHLEPDGERSWALQEIQSTVFRYEERERQPGEPGHALFSFSNPEETQTLGFILSASGATASDIRLQLDGQREALFDLILQDGESLVYQGGGEATHYSPHWVRLGVVSVDPTAFRATQGEHRLLVDSSLSPGADAFLKVELRLQGQPEPVPAR